MSVKRQRSIGSTVALPLLALGLPLVATLTGCGSNSASSPASQSSLTTVATSAATAGSDGSTAPSTTATTTSTATTTATTTATVTTSASANGGGVTGSASASSPASRVLDLTDLDMVAFASPSGKIQCTYDAQGNEVRCDMAAGHWTLGSDAPKCAGMAVGDSVDLPSSGKAELACHTDTILGSPILGRDGTSWHNRPGGTTVQANGHTLAAVSYGTTVRLQHGVSCTSTTSGMHCSNAAGHFFTISQQAYHLG